MQPQQPQNPQPTSVQPQADQTFTTSPPFTEAIVQASNNEVVQPQRKSHKKMAIFLIVWPIILIPLLIVLEIIASNIFPNSPPNGNDLFGEPSPVKRIVDILAFLGGAINIVGGLPSLIVGIILLVKGRKK